MKLYHQPMIVGRDACRLGIAPRCRQMFPNGEIPQNDMGHLALQF
jgi:hypothetical protein